MRDSKGTAATKRGVAGKDSTGIYESSTDALKEIDGAFDYWSGQVTATSLQMCYALIGANWVVFGSVGNILHSRYAIVSLLFVLLALTFNMVSAYALAEYMRIRFGYAVTTASDGRLNSNKRRSTQRLGPTRSGPKWEASPCA
jgi:hypothetical protein